MLACQHVAVDDTHTLRSIVAVAQERREFLAHQHIDTGWRLDLTAAKGYRTAQIDLAGIEQTTDEEHHRRIANGPYHLSLVHWVDVVHLYANVACRALAIEDG